MATDSKASKKPRKAKKATPPDHTPGIAAALHAVADALAAMPPMPNDAGTKIARAVDACRAAVK